MLRVVSLFCGAGGLDLGFKNEGFDLIYSVDNDPAAIDCYARNVDTRVYLRDVTSDVFKLEIDSIDSCDVILGGFPCQGFSKAGPKSANDNRNILYKEMLAAVERLRPKLFIAENVDGIYQNFKGRYVKQIVTDFKKAGYAVEHKVLDAVSFGVPQHRRRAFFVGTPTDSKPFTWPIISHTAKMRNGDFKLPPSNQLRMFETADVSESQLSPPVTIRDAIYDIKNIRDSLPDHEIVARWPHYYNAIFKSIGPGQKLCNVRHASTSVYTWTIPEAFGETTERQRLVLETIAKNRRHKKYGDIPNGNPLAKEVIERLTGLKSVERDVEELLDKGYLKVKNEKFDLKGAMFCSGLFKRPDWDRPSPTILTNFHNPRYFLHPEKNRPFSLRECARLQGFPDTFMLQSNNVTLKDGYRLIGNAVPPPVGKAFSVAVKKHLSSLQVHLETT